MLSTMPNTRTGYQTLFSFLALIRPYWKSISVFVLSGLMLTLLSLPFPWLTKLLIDDVLLRQDASLLHVVLIVTFLLSLTRALLAALRRYYSSHLQNAMACDIQLRFFKHLQHLSFSFYDRHEIAEILSRMRDASDSRRILIDLINRVVTNLFYLCIVPVIVLCMNWKLTLIAGVTLPWVTLSYLALSRIVKRYARLTSEKRAEVSARNYEFLTAIREIQALHLESFIRRRIRRLYLQFRKLDMEMRAFGNLQAFLSTVFSAAGTFLYSWYGASLVIQGAMSLGELIAFTTFIGYLYSPLASMIGVMVPVQQVVAYTRRFYEIYGLSPEIAEPRKPLCLARVKGHVVLSRVSFGYHPSRPTLKEIDLHIRPGKALAVVGRTGSGKSTLLNLLPRFYDPESGTVYLDGVDIRRLPLAFLRSQIAILMQHPYIFVGSIHYNITCGLRHFSRNQVVAAATAAMAHDFISALPQGYDTRIGERGANLSGGELQRIALARVLLLDRPILLLDEPTSRLDRQTAHEIQETLRRFARNRTTLLVAHHLSSVTWAEEIVVLEDGMVAQRGSWSQLKGRMEARLPLPGLPLKDE